VDFLQGIEDEQQGIVPGREVIVAGIVGVPDGYSDPSDIEYEDASDPTFQIDFGIGPGCTSTAGTAVPPVRIRDFARAFEVDGQPNLFSVCNDDFGAALSGVAERIAGHLSYGCIDVCVTDADPGTPAYLEHDCEIVERTFLAGTPVEDIVPPCTLTCGGVPCTVLDAPDGWAFPSDADDVCYRSLVDAAAVTTTSLDDMTPACRTTGRNLQIRIERRPGTYAADGAQMLARCTAADDPAVACP